MSKLHVITGDTVMVISGKDAGKKGKIISAMPSEGKVIVEGLNMVTRHVKPRRQGEQGGRIRKEAPMYASKVMLFCTQCNRPVRTGHKILDDNTKVRVCVKCGEAFENSKK